MSFLTATILHFLIATFLHFIIGADTPCTKTAVKNTLPIAVSTPKAKPKNLNVIRRTALTLIYSWKAFVALKDEVKEAEQIRKSVYNIMRQEQREQQPRRAQDMEL